MKPSEIFEGENSGLRKAFDEAVGREQSHTEKVLAEFDEKFEWTDFSGDIGTHILAKKTSSYATEETERNELRTFITSKINQALAEERERVGGEVIKYWVNKHQDDLRLQEVLVFFYKPLTDE